MPTYSEIKTKDDVPLWQVVESSLNMVDIFRDEADRGFVDRFSETVDSRTFMARNGDVQWDEIAGELENATIASGLTDYQKAFNVTTYAKSLGVTRDYVEDATSDEIERHIAEVLEGGRQKRFDVVFDVLKNGIADGSELWYTPDDHGGYTHTSTHDHTYTGLNNNSDDTTRVLFDDTSTHSPTGIVREMQKELEHHGMRGDTLLMDQDFADFFVEEREAGFGSSFHVPAAENLTEELSPEDNLQVAGADLLKTAWITPASDGDHTLYLYDSGANPVKISDVRQMELTDNTGAPIGNGPRSRGAPGADLLGAYGSMRFGADFNDPLTGVKVDNIQPGGVDTS